MFASGNSAKLSSVKIVNQKLQDGDASVSRTGRSCTEQLMQKQKIIESKSYGKLNDKSKVRSCESV